MSLRFFRCSSCGHKMRLGGNACGRCYAPKPLHARAATYSLVFAGICVLLAGTVVVGALTLN